MSVAPGEGPHHGVVSPEWLATRLGRPSLIVIEASWAPLEGAPEYLAAHIPGAVHLNTDDLEDGFPTWRLRGVGELQAMIGGLGIGPRATVVVYGEQFIAVCRVWWVMLVAGVRDVRILNGGLRGWRAAGLLTQAGPVVCQAANFVGLPREEFLATTGYLQERVARLEAWIGDVRSREEFEGATSGYAYLDAKGRIPASVHLGDADDSARLYVDDDAAICDPASIFASWGAAGITGAPPSFDREVIFSCGGGWRSSAAFFAAWSLGYRNIRNYSDGWCGWSTEYVRDEAVAGGTPGWRQERTDLPPVRPANDPV